MSACCPSPAGQAATVRAGCAWHAGLAWVPLPPNTVADAQAADPSPCLASAAHRVPCAASASAARPAAFTALLRSFLGCRLQELAAELAGAPEEQRYAAAGMDTAAALRERQRLAAREDVEEELMVGWGWR